MSRNPEFAQHIKDTAGSVFAASRGPSSVFAGEDGVAYQYGSNPAHGGGFGGGSRGGGGGDGPFSQSPYRSTIGRSMMTQFMASMAWQNTGEKVMDAADKYGTSQDYMSGAVSFGNGGISGGAPAYAARSALATERTGAIAYEQFGAIGEIGEQLPAVRRSVLQ